jgi:hypothetical protein
MNILAGGALKRNCAPKSGRLEGPASNRGPWTIRAARIPGQPLEPKPNAAARKRRFADEDAFGDGGYSRRHR